MTNTVLSLFAGIGGFDLGLSRAGWTVIGQVEIDPYCRQVLAKHWPDVPKHDDIKTFRGDEFGPADMVVGGPPCQPVSVAGKRQGAADDRWLWGEALRVVEHIRPRWCLFENPSGIISMGLDDILSTLEVYGYSCRTLVVPACAVGAPHRRDRVWVVAHTDNTAAARQREYGGPLLSQPEPERLDLGDSDVAHAAVERFDARRAEPAGLRGEACAASGGALVANTDKSGWQERRRPVADRTQQPAAEYGGQDVAHANGGRREQRDTAERCISIADEDRRRAAQSRLGRVLDGLPAGMDCRWPAGPGESQHDWEPPRLAKGIPNRTKRLKALGNAVVPQVVEVIGRAIVAAHTAR